MECDPAGIAAHHCDHHHAMMAFSGGVGAINRVGGDVERGVESKSEFRGHQIVVDRFWNADYLYAELREFMRNCERAIATDNHEAFDAKFLQGLDATAGIIVHDSAAILFDRESEWVAAVRSAENRPAAREN